MNFYSGFEGVNCEKNIDDCHNHMCQNGATCIDQINVYSCACTASFTGTLFGYHLNIY